ncbi:MAG: chorismate-binding protein [Actinomycetota bacterium]|nr:chorismate-binding protein [Actinomycetota bacterium]
MTSAAACLGGRWATGLREVTTDLAALDASGRWAVALPYDGDPVCARFDSWADQPPHGTVGEWAGPAAGDWESSMDEHGYEAAVSSIRDSIAKGDVYQANVCRVLQAPLPDAGRSDVAALHRLLDRGNPAPYSGFLRLPDVGVHVVTASPELFLSVTVDGAGRRVATSGPIKGTGRTPADLTDKDAAENVMIVDLVRNDLSIVSRPGTVSVPRLLEVEEHPGLVHLASYVQGVLLDEVRWPDLVDAAFPPGSVTGAPKLAALRLIAGLEPADRGFYCGAMGWVDADTGEAELAVTIRTFWIDGVMLKFGTGAGITWGSDPHAEWAETELKAARLIGLAGHPWPGGPGERAEPWQAGAP